MNKQKRIRFQLQRQLQFILNSCTLFNAGCSDEAIRIATSLRVLLHDKENERKHQGSILKHLKAKNICLWTPCKPESDTAHCAFYDVYGPSFAVPGTWNDCLNQYSIKVPVLDWWNQIIVVNRGHTISRRDLVLLAAENDGGAHVDYKVKRSYKVAMQMWLPGSSQNYAGLEELPFSNNHLFLLRRFGQEVLHSPELLALAGLTVNDLPAV